MQIEEEAAAPFLMNEHAFKRDQMQRDHRREYIFTNQLNSPLKNHALDRSIIRDHKLNKLEEISHKAKGIFRDESTNMELKQRITKNTYSENVSLIKRRESDLNYMKNFNL